jgi:hypothetical protein
MTQQQIFTLEECNKIINNDEDISNLLCRCKSYICNYFENLGVKIVNEKLITHQFIKNGGVDDDGDYDEIFKFDDPLNSNLSWYIDDIFIFNFIINIYGEGILYVDEDENIKQLEQGYGKILIGDVGYSTLGIKPTIHNKYPENSMILRFTLNGNFNMKEILNGNIVEEYGTKLFNERLDKSYNILDNFLERIKVN